MSDPTYRIEVARTQDPLFRWSACVLLAVSGDLIDYKVAHTRSGAIRRARRLVKAQARHADYPAPEVLYVDDDGRPVEGHSFTVHTVRGDNVTTTALEDRSDDPEGHSVKA